MLTEEQVISFWISKNTFQEQTHSLVLVSSNADIFYSFFSSQTKSQCITQNVSTPYCTGPCPVQNPLQSPQTCMQTVSVPLNPLFPFLSTDLGCQARISHFALWGEEESRNNCVNFALPFPLFPIAVMESPSSQLTGNRERKKHLHFPLPLIPVDQWGEGWLGVVLLRIMPPWFKSWWT